MGSRVELFLIAVIALIAIISVNSHIEPVSNKKSSLSQKSTEISDFTEYEINKTALLHTLKAKNAYEQNKKWYIKDVNITNNEIESLTAKKSIYGQNKIILNKDVKAVKRDGVIYNSQKAIYIPKSKELITPNSFTITREVNIVHGKKLIYDAKTKATTAKEVNGTFILKK